MAGHWETYLGQPRTGIGAFCEAYLPDRRLLGRTPDRGRCFQFSCCWNMTENAWEDANLHPSYVRPQGLSLFGHRDLAVFHLLIFLILFPSGTIGRTPDRDRCFQFSYCYTAGNIREDAVVNPSPSCPQMLPCFWDTGGYPIFNPSRHLPLFWDTGEGAI